ncbi:cytochrome b6-f complex Fe-S subunit [Cynara cardunculus var. scolymus]|uniref:plastoquinol--plastocyanin reductase n=1 Tax=Cynara cardunculus var. scolymus TaxID=59895 RepID=A0A103YJT1_CYNCS|nr:cytochrome b6-f complex Fe-S subunit [Cynara cardunculus var. scolymus]
MAAIVTVSPATSLQCCSRKNGVLSATKALMPKSARSQSEGRKKEMKVMCQASSISADGCPEMERRKLMNLLIFGAIGLPAAGMLVPYTAFFASPGSGGSGGGIVAKDEHGNDIITSQWLKTHGPGDRTLTQGLKNDKTLATYGINAVCTHLGCIVPWNTVEKKFVCPCHGSQYNNDGKVLKGPAHLSLALVHTDVDDDEKVVFVPWTETDFRTGDAPWWS